MHKLTTITALAALTACNIDGVRPGSQIGSETGGCQRVSEEPITDSGSAPEGFEISADEVLLALGDFSGQLERTDGEVLDLSLNLSQDGQPSVWRMELPADAMIEMACSDLIAVPAVLSLSASDALLESLEVVVLADPSGFTSFSGQLDMDEVQGSAEPDTIVVEDMAATWLIVSADYEGGWTGHVDFVAESHPEGSGDDAAISAMNDPWGDFEVLAAE